jgi:ATP-binding cassette, subfamily C (CFTR/MRP), member 1
MTMFRGAMITVIFSKTLSLKCDEYNESTALTLMSTDIDRITLCFEYFHSVWARFIEVIIGTTLLALQLGWVCVIPLVVVGGMLNKMSTSMRWDLLMKVVSSLGSTIVANMIGNRQKIWVEAIQRRIAITSSMLESMKSIKMMGLTETISATIQGQRVRETEHQAGYRWMSVWLNVIGQ